MPAIVQHHPKKNRSAEERRKTTTTCAVRKKTNLYGGKLGDAENIAEWGTQC